MRHLLFIGPLCPFQLVGKIIVFGLTLLVSIAHAATFTVVNTADSGTGSLRWAITQANATIGLDTILFNISGSGVRTISLSSVLPAITDPVVIDGTSQAGYSPGAPVIEIKGNGLPGAGLHISSGRSTIKGLIINRFGWDGILVENIGTNTIAGNFIGPDSTGTNSAANGREGIYIYNAFANTIGGTNAGDANIISGNADAGIYLYNSSNNVIFGNLIGLKRGGTGILGNENSGIILYDSGNNRIGETNATSRNLVAGNLGSGIYLYGTGTSSNRIRGNFIGTDIYGTNALPNDADGITVNFSCSNTIGGVITGAGNLISGNIKVGVYIAGPGASGNRIEGNFIGTKAGGAAALGNSFSGVMLETAEGTVIGGVEPLARNVISGNKQNGVLIGSNSWRTLVLGNYIGISASGTVGITNLFNGITVSGANSNTVGGSSAAHRNVLSANGYHGLQITSGSYSNLVMGNFLGTDSSGLAALGNRYTGIMIESPRNIIGFPQAGNVISGNALHGVALDGLSASYNTFSANLIGTAFGGTNRLANAGVGISFNNAPSNIIGGALSSSAGNVISGNLGAGLLLQNSGSHGNSILGNLIGTDITGLKPMGNLYDGISLNSASSNIIGGVVQSFGNTLAASGYSGLYAIRSSWNRIEGNSIGTGSDGLSVMGNALAGIDFDTGSFDNVVGGGDPNRNRIAFTAGANPGVKVRIGAQRNRITYNSVYANGGLGIDLGLAGFNFNDACDSDAGANSLQNFPVVTEAYSATNTTIIRGALNSTANSTFLLQFFLNSSCDGSGYGEGETYLTDLAIQTGAACSNSFAVVLPVSLPVGYFITATATDTLGNTSEFSPCARLNPVPVLSLSRGAGAGVTLAWPAPSGGFVLKSTGSLTPPVNWSTVTNTPVLSSGKYILSLPWTSTNRFFTLMLL